MNTATGFYITRNLSEQAHAKGSQAVSQALCHFGRLTRYAFNVGAWTCEIWGHGPVEQAVYASGSRTYWTCGGLLSDTEWPSIVRAAECSRPMPLNGRWVLVCLDEREETDLRIWSDWCGALPVYHVTSGNTAVVSTLEPAVVAGADLQHDAISRRGVVEMLVYGHFLGSDTLYKDMYVLSPDCRVDWTRSQHVREVPLDSVRASDDRFQKSEAELLEEAHHVTIEAIGGTLNRSPSWTLPLSGGLDSRLLAAVTKERNVDVEAWTYGPMHWKETRYAESVARHLALPWTRIDFGTDFLERYWPAWFDIFGTALHAHGAYQFPFLRILPQGAPPVLSGFMGDPLAGNHLHTLQSAPKPWRCLSQFMTHWPAEELPEILAFNAEPYLQEIEDWLSEEYNALPGEPYQKMMAVDFRNRQRRFIAYQPMLYDYHSRAFAPFLDRTYAQFYMSLSQEMLVERRLQRAMFKRYWGGLDSLPGTYHTDDKKVRSRQTIKTLLQKSGLWACATRCMRLMGRRANTFGLDALNEGGWPAVYPIAEKFSDNGLLQSQTVIRTVREAMAYNPLSYNKVVALQPLVSRIT